MLGPPRCCPCLVTNIENMKSINFVEYQKCHVSIVINLNNSKFQLYLELEAELEKNFDHFLEEIKTRCFASVIFWPLSVDLMSKLGLQTRARQSISNQDKIRANLIYIPLTINRCDFQKLKYGINHCSTLINGQKCTLSKEFCTTLCFAFILGIFALSHVHKWSNIINKKQD